MKVFAAIALTAGALVLGAAASTAGAASTTVRGPSYLARGFVPRVAHANRFAAARRTQRATGFNCVSLCSSYESTINQYFTDVAADSGLATNVYSVLPQYSTQDSNVQYSSTFAGSYVDGSPYPTKRCHDGFDTYCVTDNQLRTEIGKVIAANGWPTQSSTALYFIFTPANVGVCQHAGSAIDGIPCTTNVFCAYHGGTSSSFIYAVEPDDAAVSDGGCDPQDPHSPTLVRPAGNGADATLSTISHEAIEAITDPEATTNPQGDGWWSEDTETFEGVPDAFFGSEIGDLCAWNFGAAAGTTPGGQSYNQVINGHDYYLQQEYSNADGGCVQHAGGPTTTNNSFYDGVGPLVYHGGSVMTSTNVYAIYWVPAAPANHRLPTIAGRVTVGHKLRALHGGWSNSPAFAYRWLRCSSSGHSCKAIKKAKDSTYMLVKADSGHRLEVRVTAINQGGTATAVSAPTGKVRP